MANNFNLYEHVTDTIIAILKDHEKNGTQLPWLKPWRSEGLVGGMPRNAVTGRPYAGVNSILLLNQQQVAGYSSNLWLTHRQMTEAKGSLKAVEGDEKGWQRSTLVTFYSTKETEAGDKHGFLRYFRVFNVDQIDFEDPASLWQPPKPRKLKGDTDPAITAWIKQTGATIREGEPAYSPSKDVVFLPKVEDFESFDLYAATALHELVHWTSHEDRCKRDLSKGIFGNPEYAAEELCAELGAAMLCAELGVDGASLYSNSAAYIKSWLKALKGDKRFILTASSKASQAVRFLTETVDA